MSYENAINKFENRVNTKINTLNLETMNWNNVDMDSDYEKNQNILDPYNFNALLLEIQCNIKKENITKEAIIKQFNESLKNNLNSAKEVMESNIDNILKEAKKTAAIK